MRNRSLVTAERVSASTGLRLLEGRVTAVSAELGLLVEDDSGQPTVICAFLRTGAERLPDVCAGDRVVFVRADDPARGYVLGIVEDCRHAERRPEPPIELTLEARDRVELRCGRGSVVLTRDGRVVVKGEHVVSKATGVNKIKGAAVKIN